jgi:2-oxoglutarate dehydrogenase E2 component (dihydrolipoamide succinyltransferase)
MGESIFEGTLTKWLKKPGEKVTRDEPLFEISTDKVDAEIPAPASGVLKEVKVKEGTTVQVNTVVGVIDGDGAGASSPAPKAAAPAETKAAPASAPAQAKPATTEKATPQADGTPTKQQPQTSEAAPSGSGGAGTDVIMPQMGESIFEGTLTKWLKNVGDKVTRDEPLFEISTDKVDAEIPAPATGVLREIKVQAGTTVQVNSVVGVIGGAGAGAPAAKPAPAPAAKPPAGGISPGVQRAMDAGETEIPTQMRGRPEVEPAAKPAERQAVAEQPQQVTQFSAQSASGERIRSSPLVRRIAKDNNIDLAQIPGTGLGSRITRDDILGFVDKYGKGGAPAPTRAAQPGTVPQQAAAAPRPAAQPMQPAFQGLATLGTDIADEVVPATVMRKKIAHHMIESRRTSAHVHCMFEVDMTRIVNYRAKIRKEWEARNSAKLTYMPFFARAMVKALQQWPIVNSSFDGETIHYHKNINIGIAVALENGLIVPVVKHAEERSFVGLQRAIADVGERARTKKLKPEEVQGSTITITNPGQFGAVFGLPIINQPNAAIMGVGGINKTPLVLTDPDGNDYMAIRSVVHLTLGYDHRVIDGAIADQFMATVKKILETWNEDIG